MTKTPAKTSKSEKEEEPEDDVGEKILVKVSHYNPALGGVNCANFVAGECVSKMSSGKRWQDYMDYAIACPVELPFGTRIKIGDEIWECMDRGGAIVRNGDVYWVDQLTEHARYPFGTVIEAYIVD